MGVQEASSLVLHIVHNYYGFEATRQKEEVVWRIGKREEDSATYRALLCAGSTNIENPGHSSVIAAAAPGVSYGGGKDLSHYSEAYLNTISLKIRESYSL